MPDPMPSPDNYLDTDSRLITPDSLLPTPPYAPSYRIIPNLNDTLPPKEEEEPEKLNRKEKFSFALVLTGTILLMLGLGLGLYFVIVILQGTTVHVSMWYFIGAIVLLGFLIREWGVLMKT